MQTILESEISVSGATIATPLTTSNDVEMNVI